ncbi:MAG: DNA repair protein RadA [Thermodesulfobacteriota bacterium]
MVRIKTVFVCQSCGYQSPKWLGRCPDCTAWNTLLEERVIKKRKVPAVIKESASPQPISLLSKGEEDRLSTEIGELDRVLGSGVVLGSTVLVGGDPGIGKSTLLLEAMGRLANKGCRVLYISGEESSRQIKLRGERIGVTSDNLFVYSETMIERVLESVDAIKPGALVIDSIQSVYTESLESSPGSVSQVREAAAQLINYTKEKEIPLFLIGHVTKEGSIAGPKVLEHMVDTVLYFEGEKGHPYRILRAVKNRFGSVLEIGVFEMKDAGFEEVKNPSELFLEERPVDASGSVVVSSIEGTRPILVEIQSLVCPTVFGMPRRTVVGVDHNRVAIMLAILEKKAGLKLANHDVFLKVTGGIRLEEPAIDLGIAVSIASNFLDKAIDSKTLVFGEIGLAGEIRTVNQVELRVKEAKTLGFTRCLLPKDSLKGLRVEGSLDIIGVSSIKEAMDVLF